LKALRGLDAPSAVPEITPLLNHPNSHIVRDACRTLAVIGDKSLIPQIEPLLKNPEPAVQKDAQDAIVALKAKP
jgi:HEAT repeat protein